MDLHTPDGAFTGEINYKGKTIVEGRGGLFFASKFADLGAMWASTKDGAKKIEENADEFLKTILKLKPSSSKGTYIKSIFMSSSMSPSIPIEIKDLV